MKIDFVDEVGDNDGLSAAKLETLTKDITSKLSKTAGTIEVILVSDDKIRKLNKKFRGKNTATDVLSFPQEKFEGAKENVTGTILIAPNFAKKNSDDCQDLFVHGLLHLLGFDHESDESGWQKAEDEIKRK